MKIERAVTNAAGHVGAAEPPDGVAAIAIDELRKAQAENRDLREKLKAAEARIELARRGRLS